METNERELLSLAEEKIQHEKYDEAKTILQRILAEYNSDSIDALNDLAVVFTLTNDFKSALESIQKVLKIDPKNETAQSNLIYVRQKVGELKDSVVSAVEGLSIIIPIFNKKELTVNCLKSLQSMNSQTKFEVIIVDNASSDGSQSEIEKLRSSVKYHLKYIRNEENLGFAKANNIGARSAAFSNFLFLNNDIIAQEDFLTGSIDILKVNTIGIVGIKLLYSDKTIQHAGIAFTEQKRPEHIYKYYAGDYEPSNRVEIVQAVTGACLFIKKNVFEHLHGFDEEYVNGWEDMDLCFRVRQLGLQVIYNGKSEDVQKHFSL
jgi:cellulose synthase/poly-beta-1,6-N-acetylglucosamine synthase-like glycosyltransferase